MKALSLQRGLGLTVLAVLLALGCGQGPSARAKKPALVTATVPITDQVTDYQDFTGRLSAVKTVDVRARVTGFVMDITFREGDEVRQGDVLFKIDPRSYAADLNLAEANLKLAIADSKLQEKLVARAEDLFSRKAISPEDFETVQATLEKSRATVAARQADRDRAKLYLDFTEVVAPLTGRISQRLVDPGNTAIADQTILTTIVTENPVYAYFDVDERTYLDLVTAQAPEQRLWYSRLRSPINPGLGPGAVGLAAMPQGTGPLAALASLVAASPRFPVLMRLTTEDEYRHVGFTDFVDNRVNAGTGTIRMRGVFQDTDRILKSGLFVRIRLPTSKPYQALLIADEALQSDQGRKFIYVLTGQNEVDRRYVTLGQSIHGLRVIREGLSAGDRVIVIGQQRVHEGMKVQVKMQDPPPRPESPLRSLVAFRGSTQGDKETRKQGDKLAR